MSITGNGNEPARIGIPVGDLAGGMYAAYAVAAALYQREKTGEGSYIDISLLDSLTAMLTYVAQYYFHDGVVPGPQGTEHMSVVPYQSFKTKDGYLVVAAFTEKFWQGLCRALDLPQLAGDSRFAKNDDRRINKQALIPILAEAFATRTIDEWGTRLDAEAVPWGPVNTVDRTCIDPQILARNMKIQVEHPTIGKLPMLGNPVKVAGVEECYAPPPLRGQHTQQVLSELLGYSKEKIAQLRDEKIVAYD